MARIRSVDGDQFSNLKLRRLSILPRFVFVYLCAEAADDEGRFLLDAESVRGAMFLHSDPTTVEQVEAALQELKRAGLLAIYKVRGEVYGFLTGWFEHQNPQNPRPSSLPPPPARCAPVTSRQQADHIKRLYMEARGISNPRTVWVRDAIRWWTQEGRPNNIPTTEESRPVNEPLTDGQPPVNLSPPLPSPPIPNLSEGDQTRAREVIHKFSTTAWPPPDLHVVLQGHGKLRDALRAARPRWSPVEYERWVYHLGKSVDDVPARFTEDEVVALISEHPPDRNDRVDGWWRRMAGQVSANERRSVAQARAEAGAAPWEDPEAIRAQERQRRLQIVRSTAAVYRRGEFTGESLRRKLESDFPREADLVAEVLSELTENRQSAAVKAT